MSNGTLNGLGLIYWLKLLRMELSDDYFTTKGGLTGFC